MCLVTERIARARTPHRARPVSAAAARREGQARGEWLESWADELKDVRSVLGVLVAIELATVPGIDEELDRIAQRLERARETAGLARQTRQIVPQLGIIAFD
jgi:acyl-CoA reductase-like NAD-dependent aldehyde dehydrogenase